MKKFFRILGVIVASILIILLIIIAYIKIALPNVGPAPDMTIEKTDARMVRGAYLANKVMNCMDCHSARIFTEYAAPIDPATLGMGGEEFNREEGFPGVYYSPNITPAGIGDWTDGEIYRAITTGVRKNGKPIFPVMPYHGFGHADPEDIKSVIVYLRSLKPMVHAVPASSSDFPMNIILNTIPVKASPQTIPAATDSIAMGNYLVTIAACRDCHTPIDKGKFDDALTLAGGRGFPMSGGMIYSANITPDLETGIGSWSKEFFVQHFTAYRDSATAHRVLKTGDMQTIMPWSGFGHMTDSDLGNIYAYLHSLKPIKHQVVKFEAKH